jgi:hypothetical protein
MKYPVTTLLAITLMFLACNAFASEPAYVHTVNDKNNSSLYRINHPNDSLQNIIKSHSTRAQRYKQKFVLVFFTSTCGACKNLFRNWLDDSVAKAVGNTYMLALNAKQYRLSTIGVNINAVPAFVLLAKDGKSPARVRYGFTDGKQLKGLLNKLYASKK